MKDERSLMRRLLDAGYPRNEMYNHSGDLYVYATELATKVIGKWCIDNGYNFDWHCPMFRDQITGRPMYDCAFQYDASFADSEG